MPSHRPRRLCWQWFLFRITNEDEMTANKVYDELAVLMPEGIPFESQIIHGEHHRSRSYAKY